MHNIVEAIKDFEEVESILLVEYQYEFFSHFDQFCTKFHDKKKKFFFFFFFFFFLRNKFTGISVYVYSYGHHNFLRLLPWYHIGFLFQKYPKYHPSPTVVIEGSIFQTISFRLSLTTLKNYWVYLFCFVNKLVEILN